ncbi:uncharacterized protein BBA_10159 [Beauveria bassiana ARSEF 2860]|uniref:Uncharacterized protein n=1 Tax=Beauveria bassiana (strain ARSEF 2860) TaxID=655819 RepID=J5J1Z4_BEAB2|nr:uncharacterized protein BBA_10159 [Beauveria bassiana ARSEF 2860]EJP60893.1 hypothetical protein BBA_10159 [Beauveria bassiana ARSEF 2860]
MAGYFLAAQFISLILSSPCGCNNCVWELWYASSFHIPAGAAWGKERHACCFQFQYQLPAQHSAYTEGYVYNAPSQAVDADRPILDDDGGMQMADAVDAEAGSEDLDAQMVDDSIRKMHWFQSTLLVTLATAHFHSGWPVAQQASRHQLRDLLRSFHPSLDISQNIRIQPIGRVAAAGIAYTEEKSV